MRLGTRVTTYNDQRRIGCTGHVACIYEVRNACDFNLNILKDQITCEQAKVIRYHSADNCYHPGNFKNLCLRMNSREGNVTSNTLYRRDVLFGHGLWVPQLSLGQRMAPLDEVSERMWQEESSGPWRPGIRWNHEIFPSRKALLGHGYQRTMVRTFMYLKEKQGARTRR